MAQLMRLPSELLGIIFTACLTIQDAVMLSSANWRLHDIWFMHHHYIVTSILERDMPCYQDAIALAVKEACFILSSPTDLAYLPPNSWLPRLAIHIEASSHICAQYVTWLTTFHKKHNGDINALTFSSPIASYFVMRQLVLSYHVPQLRSKICSRLESASLDAITTHLRIGEFMYNRLDDDEGAWQDVLGKNYIIDDKLNIYPTTSAWEFAVNVLLRTYAQIRLAERSQLRT